MLLLPALAGAAPSAVVTTPQVRAELVAHAPDGVAPGKTMWLGLYIRHQPHWHTYWKNPGDSGLPTTLEWKLPAGVVAGDIQWPTPKKLPIGPLLNFGYEGSLLLPVAVTIPAGFSGAQLDVQLKADWLVCKDVCIPESGEFVLSIPSQGATAGQAALFAAAQAAMPRSLPALTASAKVEGQQLRLEVTGLPTSWQGRELDFLPETAGVIQNAAKPAAEWRGNTWTAQVPLDPQRSEAPMLMPAVFTTAGETAGVQGAVKLTSPWPASVATAAPALPPIVNATSSAAATPGTAPPANAGSLIVALGLALVGGLLLNLMPCVFPVLSLKVFGFAAQAHDRRALLAGGLAYSAGVVLSFVALAALLLALRAGGEQLGWGFQLQSPYVVAALAALFTLIALNLAGVFEVGSSVQAHCPEAKAQHPLLNQASTGVLAVAVAAPCTAPFMGASLGYALTLPAAQALLVFAALGVGMALPYLAASAWPGLARALPRPGPWMLHFKVLMSIPMWATVIWLTWVLGQQVGIDGATALLAALLVLGWLAWAWGSPTMARSRARVGMTAVAALSLAGVMVWALPMWSATAAPTTATTANAQSEWQAWSPQRVAELNAQGRTVFVDYTAAWCVTCQFNKRTTLATAEVKAAFEKHKVTLLRADWTRRDPTITAELTRLQRSGVPVYALYAPGGAGPKLLSEILSVQEVRSALESLPQ
jgi:thiol:disulfide interchange protein